MQSPIAIAIRLGRRAGRRLRWPHVPIGKGHAPYSAFLVLLLALPAAAQSECVNLGLCFPRYDPPLSAMRVYLDGVLDHEQRPMWHASGGRRTGFFQCGEPRAVVTVTVVRGTEESAPSAAIRLDRPDVLQDCAGVPAAPVTIASGKTPSERLGDLLASCLGDPSCGQFILDRCVADSVCKAGLGPHLRVDYDLDGTIGPGDALWWQLTIEGKLR